MWFQQALEDSQRVGDVGTEFAALCYLAFLDMKIGSDGAVRKIAHELVSVLCYAVIHKHDLPLGGESLALTLAPVLECLESEQDDALAASLKMTFAMHAFQQGDVSSAANWYSSVIDNSAKDQHEARLMSARQQCADCLSRLDLLPAALDDLQTVLNWTEQKLLHNEEAHVALKLGSLCLDLGETGTALSYFQRAATLLNSLHDLPCACEALGNIYAIQLGRDPDAAAATERRRASMARQLGVFFTELTCLSHLLELKDSVPDERLIKRAWRLHWNQATLQYNRPLELQLFECGHTLLAWTTASQSDNNTVAEEVGVSVECLTTWRGIVSDVTLPQSCWRPVLALRLAAIGRTTTAADRLVDRELIFASHCVEASRAIDSGDFDNGGKILEEMHTLIDVGQRRMNYACSDAFLWYCLLQARLALAHSAIVREAEREPLLRNGLVEVGFGIEESMLAGFSLYHIDLRIRKAQLLLALGEIRDAEREVSHRALRWRRPWA